MAKLSAKHYIKNLKLIERNREWLMTRGLSSKDRFAYYGYIALSYAMRNKKIKYLGNNLFYDNHATPLNLQNYPHEIVTKVLGNMEIKPKTVLDIGGNLGQFSLTMYYILKGNVKIDTFEPNSFIFEFLKKNTENTSIRTFNYGLGEKKGQVTLHFNPDRTGIGSVIKQNAGEGDLLSQDISITANPEVLTKRKRYDLIKIDVEGYEMHALKGLKFIRPKYVFVELSGQTRSKDYSHSAMLDLIKQQWGEYDLLYCGGLSKNDNTFDVLLRFD